MENVLLPASVGVPSPALSCRKERNQEFKERLGPRLSTFTVLNSHPAELKDLFSPEELRDAVRHRSAF